MRLNSSFAHPPAFHLRHPSRIAAGHLAALVAAALLLAGCLPGRAQAAPKSKPEPDVLVLSNGDVLHGKLLNAIAGKVTFHSDPLGDVTLGWDKVKELHTAGKFAVAGDFGKTTPARSKAQLVAGTLEVANQAVTVRGPQPQAAPIPVKNAQYVMDEATLDKQLNHAPPFFAAWNGAATAGANLVAATQNQYTLSGAVNLVRLVPTVPWLAARNRTSVGFSGSYGKITQPGYTNPGPPVTQVAATVTKSAISHADAERDEFLSKRFFFLAQVAFDHNFAQNLSLQQIYGGGLGWTPLKTPKEEVDIKATAQYEEQLFMSGAANSNQNLIGSTISATYLLHLKKLAFTQGLAFIPAFNNSHAYSASETDNVVFPAYKNFSFSVGTMDSYLNDAPVSLPPTKHNSFQFTMGLTYAIKSKY